MNTRKIRITNAVLLPEVISLINQGHSVTLPLRGNSMRPFLRDGRDKAVLVKASLQNLKCGDVVLAEVSCGKYVIHRIIKLSGNNIVLLGDGNMTPENCTVNDIRAIVVGFYRNGCSHIINVTSFKWRIYSSLWMALRPFRIFVFKCRSRIKQLSV